MSKVFVLDTYYKPLNPVHPGWARLLLKQGKASVYRRFPFTIILKGEVDQPEGEPLRIKIDPVTRHHRHCCGERRIRRSCVCGKPLTPWQHNPRATE